MKTHTFLFMSFNFFLYFAKYSKTLVKQPLKKRQNKDLNDKKLNEGQKYYRALPCNTFDLH